jgi:hypothetical protein
MTNSSRLERRYRALLALYPKAFRREHEQEILSVLMAAAADGQKRPRLAESADQSSPRTWCKSFALISSVKGWAAQAAMSSLTSFSCCVLGARADRVS